MNDIFVVGKAEQSVIDKARAYNNLVNETYFGDSKIIALPPRTPS